MRWLFPFLITAQSVLGEGCPAVPDYADDLQTLITEAREAPDEAAGRAASDKMWMLWLRAPDDAAQAVLDRAMRQRDSYDFVGALETFSRLVTYCPNYAEGYNQRAFTNYLSGDFNAALTDLDIALGIVPNHVGAQSGRALTLMQLERLPEARTQMLEALENNPWLGERALVAKGAVLGPLGEDI